MTTATAPDVTTLTTAIESRDADGVTDWYTADATLTILDRDHPPSAPAVYRGRDAIGSYYRDICGRNVQHSVSDLVVTEHGLAFVQHCRYPEGSKVVCLTVARLANRKIERQSVAQVWDA